MPTRATKTKSTGAKRAAKARSTKTKRASHGNSQGKRKWSAGVDTESTYPQEGLFKKDAATIARSLASKKVSPKGPASGMRMLTFYVNRAGKNLTKSRLQVLERAKELLHERVEKAKDEAKTRRSSRSRSHA
jgi:tRNA(adenine34) deaminase